MKTNIYLLITESGGKTSQYITEAVCFEDALCKFYKYYGSTHCINEDDFKLLIRRKCGKDIIGLFSSLIEESVKYFGVVNQPFVDELIHIDK